MPIYEYACEACGHRFEKLMKIGAQAPSCAECGEDRAKKLVSASAFVLKGSGWYKDHYGLKKKPAAGEGGPVAKSEGGAAGGEAKGGGEAKSGGEAKASGGGAGKSGGEAKSGGAGKAVGKKPAAPAAPKAAS